MTELAEPTPLEQAQQKAYAYVKGEAVTKLPHDLYIPPDALEVILEAFTGPMDLLLYLIKKHNLDILDIPMVQITEQYIAYVEFIKSIHLELAADYLVMAAMLAEIKSRMLLPRPVSEIEEEIEDPRAELVRRLRAYEQFKQAAQDVDALPRLGRDVFTICIRAPEREKEQSFPPLELPMLLDAIKDVMRRTELYAQHHITREPLSVRERMSRILTSVQDGGFVEFLSLFDLDEGRAGVVVTFLAILELAKESLIEISQNEKFAPIYVRTPSPELEERS